jgi:hypothetical protein
MRIVQAAVGMVLLLLLVEQIRLRGLHGACKRERIVAVPPPVALAAATTAAAASAAAAVVTTVAAARRWLSFVVVAAVRQSSHAAAGAGSVSTGVGVSIDCHWRFIWCYCWCCCWSVRRGGSIRRCGGRREHDSSALDSRAAQSVKRISRLGQTKERSLLHNGKRTQRSNALCELPHSPSGACAFAAVVRAPLCPRSRARQSTTGARGKRWDPRSHDRPPRGGRERTVCAHEFTLRCPCSSVGCVSWLPVSVSPDSLQRGSTSKERLCAHGAPPAKETEGAQWQQCIVPFHTSRFVQFISHSSPFLAALCVFFPLAAPVLLFAALCFFRRSSSQRRRFLQPRH